MNNEKLSNKAQNSPLRKGVVSGSTDSLSEKLPLIEYNDYEYKPHIAFYGSEWEIWYQSFNNRIPQNVLMNKYGDSLNEVLRKMINEVLSSGLKYYR